MIELSVENLGKRFGRRTIFESLNFHVTNGECLVATGPNGSGKSTLCKILATLLRPSSGKVHILHDSEPIAPTRFVPMLGYVAPYIMPYRDLTAWENLEFVAHARIGVFDEKYARQLLERVGLKGRELDLLRTYSSGMVHRFRYALALISRPDMLILDEPTANLDVEGAEVVYQLIDEQKGKIPLVIATNEPHETRFGTNVINLAK